MQAIDQRSGNVATDIYTRVMAAFGTLVAVVLIGLAIVYGGVLIQGALAAKTTTAATSITAPLNLAFRAGERGDGTLSSASLQNQFRAGERGDTVSH